MSLRWILGDFLGCRVCLGEKGGSSRVGPGVSLVLLVKCRDGGGGPQSVAEWGGGFPGLGSPGDPCERPRTGKVAEYRMHSSNAECISVLLWVRQADSSGHRPGSPFRAGHRGDKRPEETPSRYLERGIFSEHLKPWQHKHDNVMNRFGS